MIVVGTSIMLRYKKTICPIHHQTEHINSGLLYKERAFRRHKDNTKSRHIHRRRTFSPLIYLQFSNDGYSNCVGDKIGGVIYIISLFLKIMCIIVIFAMGL